MIMCFLFDSKENGKKRGTLTLETKYYVTKLTMF